jgi:hypothetical protein
MKKLVIVLALTAIIVTGTAFADHPKGLGIGVLWSGEFFGGGGHGAALSLKVPSVPLYWGIQLRGWSDVLYIGVTGDSYVIDQTLVKDIGLGWFFGIGGYGGLLLASNPNIALGLRLPIGLSWMPVKVFELFFGLTPTLGINLNPFYFPTWGAPLEVGLRLWL